MNKPQSIDEILDRLQLQAIGRSEHLTNPMMYKLDIKEAKSAIEAMVREIIGRDELSLVMSPRYMKIDSTGRFDNTWTNEDDAYREAHIKTSLQMQQRLRASKYNLKLEKE